MISPFSTIGTKKTGNEEQSQDIPIDERKVEEAVSYLASEVQNVDENNPRQAAQLMRKLAKMTGIKFSEGMEEAVNRLEDGEDPEAIEAELGDILEKENPFEFGDKARRGKQRSKPPQVDNTLYEL